MGLTCIWRNACPPPETLKLLGRAGLRAAPGGGPLIKFPWEWERDVLDTPMMDFILEYLFRETEGYPDAWSLLRCSITLSGRRLGENKKPVFQRLNNFREYILDLQFDEGGWSSEYYFPTP